MKQFGHKWLLGNQRNLICDYCGKVGHNEKESVCPKRKKDAEKFEEWGRATYPKKVKDDDKH